MAFTRYFDNDIKEWIETQGEYDIAYTISNMELKDLDEFMGLLKAEARVEYELEKTHLCRVTCKKISRRYQEFKRNGVERNPVTWWNIAVTAVMGFIIGEIVTSLIFDRKK
ncbi:MAG: hypothetical protein ACKVH8_18440 [Pirellulales bacterium]